MSLDAPILASYLAQQLHTLFPDEDQYDLQPVVTDALGRLEYCFAAVKLSSYHVDNQVYFDHLHSDQYACFLYFVSNSAWSKYGNVQLAKKIFFLNKALNGLVCMYDTALPRVFVLIHSVGIVLGKAQYSDHLVVCQNVTVGSDRGYQPKFGDGVVLFGGSSVIGACNVGGNVSVSASSVILNQVVPAGHIVAGRSPNLTIKPAKRVLIAEYFDL